MGRLGLLLRGIFLYNSVYWRRASDGLKPPRISSKERQRLRPKRDLKLIKPRERPRANADPQEVADYEAYLRANESPATPAAPAPIPKPAVAPATPPTNQPFKKAIPPAPQFVAPQEADAPKLSKRKRRRVRHKIGGDGFGGLSPGSLMSRFFKKKD